MSNQDLSIDEEASPSVLQRRRKEKSEQQIRIVSTSRMSNGSHVMLRIKKTKPTTEDHEDEIQTQPQKYDNQLILKQINSKAEKQTKIKFLVYENNQKLETEGIKMQEFSASGNVNQSQSRNSGLNMIAQNNKVYSKTDVNNKSLKTRKLNKMNLQLYGILSNNSNYCFDRQNSQDSQKFKLQLVQ